MVQSTELFLEYLAAEAEKEAKSHGKKTIGYDEMYVLPCFAFLTCRAKVVNKRDELEFLADIIPTKKTMGEGK